MTVVSILPRAFPIVWSAWGLFWLLMSRWSAPVAERQPPTRRLLHLSVVLVGGALFFASPSADSWLGREVLGIGLDTAIAGLVITVLGLGFASWARIILGRMWSGQVTLKEGHVIVDHGPYALARHPIYTGILLALAGSALARDTVAGYLGLAITAVGLVLKLGQEERLLIGHFGAPYEEYRRRVKGLVPLVW